MFIEVRQLTKQFPSPKGVVCALKQVTLQVAQGEIVSIMGSNGAGKSTLLRILAGLLLPTQGTVHIDGINAAEAPAIFRKQIGFAAGERPGFYDRLTGRQNLDFFAALHGLFGNAGKHRIHEVLEQTAVASPDQPYQELSTGMKQRLLLARTLLHDPALLLLDEPTRSLDPAEAERFHQLIRRLQGRGKTIIFTTHQRQEAESASGRLVTLNHGCIEAESAIAELAAV